MFQGVQQHKMVDKEFNNKLERLSNKIYNKKMNIKNKSIRISEKIKDELKRIRNINNLNSMNEVIEGLLKEKEK